MNKYSELITIAKDAWSKNNFEKALEIYQIILKEMPTHPEANRSMAFIMDIANRKELSLFYMKKAVEGNPENVEYLYDYGTFLLNNNKYEDAIEEFKKALKIDPENVDVLNHIGASFNTLGNLTEAEKYLKECIRLDSSHYLAYTNLANIQVNKGCLLDGLENYKKALEINSKYMPAFSNMLFSMMYSDDYNSNEVFEKHLLWEKNFKFNDSTLDIDISNITNKKIPKRIGYVSSDFKIHSVAFFIIPILMNHNKEKFEIYCYSNVSAPDEFTKVIEQNCTKWINIYGKSDIDVIDIIKKDDIDILVDLSGHTANSRISLFLHKSAPLQVTYLGYPNTTGLSKIDYKLTDLEADPLDQDKYYTEKLYRLPNGFLCYMPISDAPNVLESPCIKNGFITFGSFNNLPKINSKTIDLWCNVLKGVENSRLIIKTKYFKDLAIQEEFKAKFINHGIDFSRIKFYSFSASTYDHLNLYNDIDIALDTFPYNGTTTTLESLWMGVPVISMFGKHHASRVGKSILTKIGLSNMAVDSAEKFVELAKFLSSDVNQLSTLRKNIRNAVIQSPLRDGLSFTRNLEKAYLDMWEDIIKR